MRHVNLAAIVKKERDALGLSQRDLGLAVSTSPENIAAIEDGRNRQPSVEILRGLSSALNVPLVKLLLAMANELKEPEGAPQLAGLPDFRTYVKLLFPDDPDAQEDLLTLYKAKMKRRRERRAAAERTTRKAEG